LAYGRVLRTLRTDQTVWNHPVLSGRLRGMRRRDFLKGMAALLPVASVLGSSRGPRRDLVSAEYLVDSNQWRKSYAESFALPVVAKLPCEAYWVKMERPVRVDTAGWTFTYGHAEDRMAGPSGTIR